MANIIVTSTINEVKFKVDNGSYNAALKKIKAMKTAWTDSSGAALKASRQFEQAGKTFRKSQEWQQRVYNPTERKAQSERLKAQRAEAALARRTNQIRAAGIRFNTKNTAYNLTAAQRTQAISDFASLSRQYHTGGMALAEYNARLAQLHQRMRNIGGLAKKPINVPVKAQIIGLDSSLMSGMGGIMGGYAAFGLGRQVMETGQSFEAAKNGLTAVMGGAEQAGKEFEYLRNESNRLGLDLIQTTKDYTRFAASANGKLDNSQIHSLFEGVSEYGRVVGATADEQSRSLRALQQMLSKSKLSAEEVRQQMAESLPNSVGLLTKALNQMKGTTNLTEADLFKLMEDGKLFAKDILPFLADEMKKAARAGGALDAAVKSNAAAMQRMNTASQDAMNALFHSGFGDALTRTFDTFTAILNDNTGAFETFGSVAGGVLDGFTSGLISIHDTFITVEAMLKAEFPGLIGMFEGFGEKVGKIAGIGLFTVSVFKLAGAIKWLVSFANPLKAMLLTMQAINALGGADAVGGADSKQKGKTKTGSPKAGGKGLPLKGMGRAGGILAAFAAMSEVNDLVNPWSDNNQEKARVMDDVRQKLKDNPDAANSFPGLASMFSGIGSWFSQEIEGNYATNKLNYQKPADKNGWVPSYAQPTVNLNQGMPAPQLPAWANQPLRGEAEIKLSPIEIRVNEGNLKGLITAAVEENNLMQYNLLLGVPE